MLNEHLDKERLDTTAVKSPPELREQEQFEKESEIMFALIGAEGE